jgi:hypothetical protein
MIRTGIYNLRQFKQKTLKDAFGKEKNISLEVYSQLNQEISHELNERYAEIILNRFNSSNNVIKRTYRNRFNSFDDLGIGMIQKLGISSPRIHDMAVSDGRASYYFLEKIQNCFPSMEYHASDLVTSYIIHKKSDESGSYLITDNNLNIIEITVPPFVWNYARKEGNLYFINNFLKAYFRRKFYRRLIGKQLKFIKTLPIVDYGFKSLLDKSDKYKLISYNVFEKSLYQYNVIRAMNLLHFGYFKAEQLYAVLDNIYESLLPEGILIEGSNEDAGSPVEGAVYQKTNKGFELIISSDKPSRILEIVLSYNRS